MNSRSRTAFTIGLVVFAVGTVAALYLAFRTDAGSEQEVVRADVLVATRNITSGTSGSNAVAQGSVERRSVPASALPDGALREMAELAGKVAVVTVGRDEILTSGHFLEAQTRIGTLIIPPGMRALAVQLENVPGVAGFAGAGDHIDVFGVASANDEGDPTVQMVLQGVEVLNVNGTILAPSQGQPGGQGLVFLLAVTPTQAERVIYLDQFERLYFTLVPDGEEPVAPTPGIGPDSVLAAV